MSSVNMAKINEIILGFVFVLIGAILIGVVADETTNITQQKTIVNETISVQDGIAVNLANSQLDSFTSLVNSSNTSQTFVENTDYTVDLSGGSVTGDGISGNSLASYVYRDVGNATSRTLINLILIFFAIGVMALGAGTAIKGLRDAGIL